MRLLMTLLVSICLTLHAPTCLAQLPDKWQPLSVVTPGETDNAPPSDAIVLFDGTDFSQWGGGKDWKIVDGVAVVGTSWLTTKEKFGDCQIHVEWSAPLPVVGEGAFRGNSGIFLMGRYELQIMDSFENPTAAHRHAGAVYRQTPPAVIAVRPPGEWNSYDIFWTAPRFTAAGALEEPAYITVMLNGVLLLNHVEVLGKTSHLVDPVYKPHAPRHSFSLQNHNSSVRFRNIWARDFRAAEVDPAHTP